MSPREQPPQETLGIFEPHGPLVVLWQADALLASLLLRFAQLRVEVRELEEPAAWASNTAGRRVALLVGALPLRQPDHLRFVHRVHRSEHVLVIGCGGLDAQAALVAGELGVATIVSTIHDAPCAARALRTYFETSQIVS